MTYKTEGVSGEVIDRQKDNGQLAGDIHFSKKDLELLEENDWFYVRSWITRRSFYDNSLIEQILNPVRFRIAKLDQLKRFGIDYVHVESTDSEIGSFNEETYRQLMKHASIADFVRWSSQFRPETYSSYYRPIEWYRLNHWFNSMMKKYTGVRRKKLGTNDSYLYDMLHE